MIKLIVGFLLVFLITFGILIGVYMLGKQAKKSPLQVLKISATLAVVLVITIAVVSTIIIVG